jgi:hypothetical protein
MLAEERLDPRSPTSVAVSEMDGEAKDPLQTESALIVALTMLDQWPYNPSLRPCSIGCLASYPCLGTSIQYE